MVKLLSCAASFIPPDFKPILRIQINGEPREFPQSSLALSELLETLSLTPQRIAVEVNKTIVPRGLWEKTILKDGDQIEIVHFVGGGKAV
jgi:thiamine biosynthesis protein ThiS